MKTIAFGLEFEKALNRLIKVSCIEEAEMDARVERCFGAECADAGFPPQEATPIRSSASRSVEASFPALTSAVRDLRSLYEGTTRDVPPRPKDSGFSACQLASYEQRVCVRTRCL